MKKKTNKIVIFLLSLTMIMSMLASCTQKTGNIKSSTSSKTSIDTFIIGSTMNIPSISRQTYDYNVLSGTLTHMALVRQDENGEIQPFMAESFSPDAESKVWTFKLRKGLTWHDGEKVTTKDVKFTLEKEKMRVDEIKIIDDETIHMIFSKSNSRFPIDLVTMRIIPEHIFKNVKDMASFTEDAATIGCGPYKFKRFDKSAGILEFTAYENFIDGKPNVDNVIVKLYANTDTLYMALEKGEIDMVYFYANGVDSSVVSSLSKNNKITLQQLPDTGVNLIYFNTQAEPVNNVDIRKGIAYSIDYPQFAKLFGTEYAKVGNFGVVPKGSLNYIETPKLEKNKDLAKKYFTKAGAVDSNNDGILEYKGKDLNVEFLVRTDKPVYARMAELLTANLKEVGVKVVLKKVDTAQFRTISEKEKTHQAMITRATPWGMVMKAGLGVGYMDSRSTGQANINDPAFWKLSDKMISANPKEYKELCAQVQNYYAENVPAIPLYWDQFIQAYSSKYEGFSTDSTFGLLNMKTWYTIKIK